jgi:hypothetical protein
VGREALQRVISTDSCLAEPKSVPLGAARCHAIKRGQKHQVDLWVHSLSPTWSSGHQPQRLPLSRRPTAGMAKCLPDVASRVGGWLPWAQGTNLGQAGGWRPGEECAWLAWGWEDIVPK